MIGLTLPLTESFSHRLRYSESATLPPSETSPRSASPLALRSALRASSLFLPET